jgi:hypothetical protein
MAHAHCMLDTQGYKHADSGCVIFIPVLKWLYFTNAPQRYVIRTLPVLLYLESHRVLIRTVH